MPHQITNIAGYKYTAINDTAEVFEQARSICSQTHIKGNIFISSEGINLGIASSQSDIDYFLQELNKQCGINNLLLNTTFCENIPFKRLLIKVRKELVPTQPIGSEEIPSASKNSNSKNNAQHLSIDDFKKWLDEGKDMTLLDICDRLRAVIDGVEKILHVTADRRSDV